jgi:hypothetical protein
MRRVAAMLLLPGCFYTDRVNSRPHAHMVVGPPNANVGTTLILDASSSSDDEGDPLTYAWVIAECVTPSDCRPVASSTQPTWEYTIQSHYPHAIQLLVADVSGAADRASDTIAPQDLTPTVTATVQGFGNPDGTFTLGRKLAVLATGSDPDGGDKLTYTFELTPPATSDPDKVDFGRLSPTGYELVPDVVGHWEVKVTVDDGWGMTASDRVPIDVVDDAPPVIAATTPDWSAGQTVVLQADGPRRFSVDTVTDDLDPYPYPAGTPDHELGVAHFKWFLGGVEIAGHDLPDFTLDPSAYAPGDVVDLRVEAYDRIARTWPCDATVPVCPSASPRRVSWQAEIR